MPRVRRLVPPGRPGRHWVCGRILSPYGPLQTLSADGPKACGGDLGIDYVEVKALCQDEFGKAWAWTLDHWDTQEARFALLNILQDFNDRRRAKFEISKEIENVPGLDPEQIATLQEVTKVIFESIANLDVREIQKKMKKITPRDGSDLVPK